MRRILAVVLIAPFVLVTAGAAPLRRAIAYVQSATGTATSTDTVATSGAISVTTGNFLVVSVGSTGAGTTVSTLSDGTNTFTSRCGHQFLTGAGGLTQFTSGPVTGGSLTFTAVLTASASDLTIAVDEYSGVDSFDAAATAATGTSTSPSVSITTVAANALVNGAFRFGGAGGDFTAGSGYTRRTNLAPGQRMATEDQVFASTGAHNADGTVSSIPWVACAVSLAPTAGASSFVPAIINNPIRGGGGRWFESR